MSKWREIVKNILKENNIVLDEEQVIYRTYADKPYLNDIEDNFMNKPTRGLWGCRDDSWKEWCEENDFGYNPHYFEWTLKPGSKLYTVNNRDDFIYLLKNYQAEGSNGSIFISYLKLAKDYDAIELTQNGNIALHYGIETDDPELQDPKYTMALTMAMNTWDVPSICVFNPSKAVDIIEKPIEEDTIKLVEAKIIKVGLNEFEWLNDNLTIPYLRVYKNPTRSELMSICSKAIYKELRGLCVDNTIYIWDAYYSNHSDIVDYLYRINDIINVDSIIYFMIISDTLYISNNLDLPIEQLLRDCLDSKLSSIFSKDEIEQATDYHDAPIIENIIKQGNLWTNKGKEGTHGAFKTKKEADNQRKAMFANGYKG